MQQFFALTLLVALIGGCTDNSNPVVGQASAPAAKAMGTASTDVVSATTITANVSNSRRGKWITSSGLNLVVAGTDGNLIIDRIGHYTTGGDFRFQLSRKSSGDDFNDHWDVDDPLFMTITVRGVDIGFKLHGVGGSWAGWRGGGRSYTNRVKNLQTGDTFTFSIRDLTEVVVPPNEIAAERNQRNCVRTLVDDVPDPTEQDGWDLDVWDDKYDSCFSETLLSSPCDPFDPDCNAKNYLTDCERLACYVMANCHASGESDCSGPLLRD